MVFNWFTINNKKEDSMEKLSSAGLLMCAIGIFLLVMYGLYLGFEKIFSSLDFVTGFVLVLVVGGIIISAVSIFLEQRRDTKKMIEKIKKDNLKP
jgi:hypothetical protein